MSGTRDVHTFCRVCEPACGLVATVDGGSIVRLRADRDHPVTKGFSCPKGIASLDIHRDPDRLNTPRRRTTQGWVDASWPDAIDDIATRLRAIIDEHGPDAVGVYIGNPSAFNTLAGPAAGAFIAQLGTSRVFSSGTQDCANKFAGSEAVFGSSTIHPIPDIEHTDALLVLGANPRVSKGSFISIANPHKAIMQAASRGASVWFVNPRHTESAGERTGETLLVRPDTDVYLLAAMLHAIDRGPGFDAAAVDAFGSHVDELRAFIGDYAPERVADVVGLDASIIEQVGVTFATADSAAVHMSTGVNMGRHGTVAYWLVHMLSFVTGNLDKRGGNVLSQGFYASAKAGRRPFDKGFVDGAFGAMRRGTIPGNLMADYMTRADPPLKAMFSVAGNPALSIGGSDRIVDALDALDLVVCIDLYRTATGDHADWLLPATDMLERADINITGLGLQYEPWVQWTDAVVPPTHDRKEEWRIFAELSQAMGLRSALDAPDAETEVWSRIDHMLAGRGLDLDQVRARPHGVVFEDGREPGSFFTDHLQTTDGKVDCCPAGLRRSFGTLATDFDELAAQGPDTMKLISRRDSRMHNSWYANVAKFKRGARRSNPLSIHPADAERLALADGQSALVRSAWGEIDVPVTLDPSVRVGVVAIEHGWGRQTGMALASDKPGVNVNKLLPNGEGSFDPLSNQAWMTGIPVTITATAVG